MIPLHAPTVLLQWATGGLFFLWVTTRLRLVGLGYGWLLRGIYLTVLFGAVTLAAVTDRSPLRDGTAVGSALAVVVALLVSVQRRKEGVAAFPPSLDLVAPAVGTIGLVAAGLDGGGPPALAILRTIVGAAFLGAVSDAMLLGHWYLVQPGLPRAPLHMLNRAVALAWPFEIALLLWPVGMVSVLNGRIDDGYGGILGWFWVACAITTIALCAVTAAALREPAYSAVMAATGLLYLSILTAFGTDLIAKALLA